MKTKIKNAGYALAALALAAPAVVSAQFTAPEGTGLASNSLFNVVKNLMNWLLALVGIAGVIGFAIAGILYLTSAGDDDRIKQAKKAMTMAIIGVIVALAGLVALQAAQGLWGAQKNF